MKNLLTYSKSLAFTLMAMAASSLADAQQFTFASNRPGNGLTAMHSIPNAPVVTIKSEPVITPVSTEEFTLTNEIDIAGSVVENHLLIMSVKTQKNNLTTAVYDGQGTRLTYETFIDAGTYRMIDHTRNLKAGTYYLYVMENGKVIEKEKFLIK